MEKVTYTKAQLMAFTVKEMKTLSLFSNIDPKGLDKKGIVKALMGAQRTEQKASKKATPVIKKETRTITKKPVVKTKGKVKKTVKAKAKEKVKVAKSGKPDFHRAIKGRNPMTFR